MDTALNRRRVAALEKALHATNDAELADAVGKLRPLGFATRSDEIRATGRGRRIRDFFGQKKGNLVPLAVLPRELWPRYLSKRTRGNAVWLCHCQACERLTTMPSRELNPASHTQSCGCSRRASHRSGRMALA